MWPTLFEVDGPLALHTYGLMVMSGLAAGSMLALWRGSQVGLAVEAVLAGIFVAPFGGFLGAKILYAIGVNDLASMFSLTGGYAWYGGLLGGAAAVIAVTRAMGVDTWKLADVAAPAVLLGSGLGRVGCFFAGCCHGVPVAEPTPATALLPEGALQGQIYAHPHFPYLSTAFDGGVARIVDTPLYPTQLWQATGSFTLVLFLLAASQWRRFDGQIMALYLLTEPWLRIFVESFRGDHRGYALSLPASSVPEWLPGLGAAGAAGGDAVVGVTTSQAIGLAMVLMGLGIWWWRRDAGVSEETPTSWSDDLIAP